MLLKSLAIEFSLDRGLLLLDQTLLPCEIIYLNIQSLDQMVEAIQSLRVRGAPLIGISASLFWSHWLVSQNDSDLVRMGFEKLRSSRPTAVNLMNNLDACWNAYVNEPKDNLAALRRATELFFEDQKLCENISQNVSSLIDPHDSILTYCNTGGLATAGIGTALGGIKKAFDDGRALTVFTSETRPLGQGARLTFFELQQARIPSQLICDNAAAHLMQQGRVNKIFVGADRITRNGDVANKIGTYSLAVLASYHKLPFYVVAPSTTCDFSMSSGKDVQIEQRPGQEILKFWGIQDGYTYNPGFDVTPSELITKIITENGVFDPNKLNINNRR